MWGTLLKLTKLVKINDNGQEVSFLDVKELYDAAYAEKAKAKVNLKKFKGLIEQAQTLDALYRVHLQQQANHYTASKTGACHG